VEAEVRERLEAKHANEQIVLRQRQLGELREM